MSNKKLSSITLMLIILLIVMTESAFGYFNSGLLINLEEKLLEPLFFGSIAFFVCSLFFYFFPEKIFKLWLRKIVIWFLPLSVILLSIWDGGNDLIFPSRTEVAIVFGIALVSITLVFALVQRFYYKVK